MKIKEFMVKPIQRVVMAGTAAKQTVLRRALPAMVTLATLGASIPAQAGVETNKLVGSLGIFDVGTFVSVATGGGPSETECGTFRLIVIPKDANYDARIAMLLAAKAAGVPVTIGYAVTNGACVANQVQW